MKRKLKKNDGSALVLVIIATALLTIFIMIISSQINNQIKSNRNAYDDMKYKYSAEAGIERSIYDIENQIIEKVPYKIETNNEVKLVSRGRNHSVDDSCPKVKFENGKPIIGSYWGDSENTFYKTIYYEIIEKKTHQYPNYNTILHDNIISVLPNDEHIAKSLLNTYLVNIDELIRKIAVKEVDYNKLELEKNINNFINEIKEAKILIDKIGNEEAKNKKAIEGLDMMIDYMEEIKCRLMFDNDDQTDTGNEQNEIISIKIPEYIVSIQSDNELKFKDNPKYKDIVVKRAENGELKSIDLSEMNNLAIVSTSEHIKITANIDFIFIKEVNNFKITQEIKSYGQQKN